MSTVTCHPLTCLNLCLVNYSLFTNFPFSLFFSFFAARNFCFQLLSYQRPHFNYVFANRESIVQEYGRKKRGNERAGIERGRNRTTIPGQQNLNLSLGCGMKWNGECSVLALECKQYYHTLSFFIFGRPRTEPVASLSHSKLGLKGGQSPIKEKNGLDRAYPFITFGMTFDVIAYYVTVTMLLTYFTNNPYNSIYLLLFPLWHSLFSLIINGLSSIIIPDAHSPLEPYSPWTKNIFWWLFGR